MTPQDIARRIASAIDANRHQLIEDTRAILRYRTVSGGDAREQADYEHQIPECFAWLSAIALRMGFDFRVIDGIVGEIAWKHKDPQAPIVGIAAHIDVVTARGEWTHPPFAGEIADDHVWGRGVMDDKGPLVQVLHALHAIKCTGIELPCTIKVIIGTQEETGDWSDIAHYLAKTRAPDVAFTPDAEFPIINGEKGMISVVFKARWPRTGIDRETGVEFVSLVGGERENIVPPLCELKLRFATENKTEVMKEMIRSTTEYVVEHRDSNITVQQSRESELPEGRTEAVASFLGKAAHSSTPGEGYNAILDALDYIKDIQTIPEPARRFGTFLYIAGAEVSGENIGIACHHDFIGDTTVCLSLAEITPTGGAALLNVRPTMGSTCAEVLAKCQTAAKAFTEATGLEIEVEEKYPGMDPIYLDPDDPTAAPFINCLRHGFELVTGKQAELRSVGGTTYAKALPNCCAFGPALDEPELAHQPDERFPIEGIVRNAKIYGTSLALLSTVPLRRAD